MPPPWHASFGLACATAHPDSSFRNFRKLQACILQSGVYELRTAGSAAIFVLESKAHTSQSDDTGRLTLPNIQVENKSFPIYGAGDMATPPRSKRRWADITDDDDDDQAGGKPTTKTFRNAHSF